MLNKIYDKIRLSEKLIRLEPGDIAALICFEAEYICLTKGIRFITHSPTEKTAAPIHDETKTPTKKTKSRDVINPSPANSNHSSENHCSENKNH